MNKELSISVAAYNAEQYLRKCLDSFVACKSFEKLEIIVVDDGSSDSTLAIAQQYNNQFPESIRIISKENGGHGSTINASIREFTGRYYKIVDADDWVESEELDKLVAFIESNNSDIILNPYYEVNASDQKKQLCYPHSLDKKYEVENASLEELSDSLSIAMHSMTFRADVVKSVGPVIDEKCFYVDAEYTLYLLAKCQTISVLSYPIYDYLLGTATQSMNEMVMQKRRNQHLTVVMSLVRFYNSLPDGMGIKVTKLIKTRIVRAIQTQYRLYLLCKEADKKEFIDFDIWLKENSKDLYNSVVEDKYQKCDYAVSFLRRNQFKLFTLIKKILLQYRAVVVRVRK